MVLCFLVLIAFLSQSLSVSYLKFEKINGASEESLIFLNDANPTALLDASANTQRIVYFAQKSPPLGLKLTFACHVNTQAKPLDKVSLCCRSSVEDTKRTCVQPEAEGTFSCLNTEFHFSADETTGANFSISLTQDGLLSNPISGLFSCIVGTDELNVIESNEIEIRDAVFYILQLKGTPSAKIDVVPPISEFPYELRCVDDISIVSRWPYWMHQLDGRYGPYRWEYCLTTGKPNAITCYKRPIQFSPNSIVEFINGSVYLTDAHLVESKSIAIVCKHVGQLGPIRTFAGKVTSTESPVVLEGLSIDKTKNSSSTKLYPLTTLSSSYVINKGTKLQDFMLRALYRQPQGDYEFHWFKDEQMLHNRIATKYSYTLPSLIDESVSGVYSLVVKSNEDISDRLIFTYDVKVVSPPFFKDPRCLKELFYVMEGNNFGTVCEFDGRWNTVVYVGVASFEAPTYQELRMSIDKNLKYSKQQLSQLDIIFHVDGEEINKRITVNITKLKLNQDCELSIRLHSTYGQSRISTSLKVVPKPQLTISPSDENCIKDCDETPYNVSCALNENIVQEWKSKFNIEPSIDWIIQNHWTKAHLESTGLGQFITSYGEHDTTLTVWPVGKPIPFIVKHEESHNKQPKEAGIEEEEEEVIEKEIMNLDTEDEPVQIPSTTTLKQFLAQKIGGSEAQPPKDLILSCWIRLSVTGKEAEFEIPNGLISHHSFARQAQFAQSSATNRLIYDSRWETDTELAKQLTAFRTFTPDIIPATASLAWVAAVIIGVIIFIVVIASSIWLCTRDRGETYMVYDKERAHGNDPIQELKEKETFQTFQRQEEPRIATSRYSLNDGSVRFDSEDDGELDEYADNFNEEASFLGQYSGNRAISKKSIQMKEASPELSTIGIFNTTNTATTTTNTTNTSDHSDLLHNLTTAVSTPNQPIHFITRENHQTAV
uniref:Bravo_FIGEY domain-containing protein n=1 Tax=Schistosoma mansoni TaxID=6183 RepID=A0A5K4ELB7_SCHMA